MKIVTGKITHQELKELAQQMYGDFVKAVVDIERSIMAVGGEMHADEERLLLEQGSQQEHLWGINLYPDKPQSDWIEFDSMINLRPRQGNKSRDVEDPSVRTKIIGVVQKLM